MSPSLEMQQLQATLQQFESSRDRRSYVFLGYKLTFDSTSELRYQQYCNLASQPMQRQSLLLVFLLLGAFLAVDGAMGGTLHAQPWLWLTVILLCAPPVIFLLWMTYTPSRQTLTHPAAVVAGITNGLGLVIVNAMSLQAGLDSTYEIQALQMIFNFFLLGLRWQAASVVAALIVMAQMAALLALSMPEREVFMRVFMLASTAIFGGIGCYLLEQTQRLSWLRGEVMQALSERDSITGLYNHRVFYERGTTLLRQAQRENTPVAVIVVDADHFKQFNDIHGHLAGDDCLRMLAQTLLQTARRPLDVAARIGGEEFALLLYGMDQEAARQRAEELCNAVRGLTIREGVRITVSAGLAARHPQEDSSIEALVGRADRALYLSKSLGRDRVSVDTDA